MTTTQPATAANFYRNIVALLNGAMHPGAHAVHVAQSIDFLEQLIAAEEAKAAPLTPNDEAALSKADAKRERKAKKAVTNA